MKPEYEKDISDQELLSECLDGNKWAWETFYGRFANLITYTINITMQRFGIYLSSEDIKECEQFIWVYFLKDDCKALKRWEKRCSLPTWIRACAGKASINFLKSKKKLYQEVFIEDIKPEYLANIFSSEGEEKTPSILRGVEYKELMERVNFIVNNRLTIRERLFVSLYWFDGLSNQEISQIMGISANNLYLLKHRIAKKIKGYL